MRINPSTRTLICLMAVGVLLMGFCGFVYKNRAGRLSDLQSQLDKTEKQVMESEQTVKRLAVVEQEYLDAQTKLSVLETGVSTKAYVPTLLRQLELLGRGVNLRVVGVRPRPAAEKPQQKVDAQGKPIVVQEPYEKLVLDIEVNGRYWDVVKFLEALRSFPKIVAVNEVHINPIGDTRESGSPELSVRLNTTAFILKETPSALKEFSDKSSDEGEQI